MASDGFSGPKILEFMNNILATDVQFKVTMKQMLFSNLMVSLVVMGAVLFVILAYDVLIEPAVWFYLSMLVFFVSMGGYVHIKREKPAPWGSSVLEDGTTSYTWFNDNNSIPNYWEGFIVAGLFLTAGLCLLVALNAPKITSSGTY